MQRIRLKGNHFYKVERGATSVIRLSKLTPNLGAAVLYCDELPRGEDEIKIVIQRVTVMHFEELNAFDVSTTGFRSLEELREQLQVFYDRKLKDRDTVKVISFFLYKSEDKKQNEQ